MALTRKFLAALGIEAEKVDEIIQAHTETVDGLKAERDRYKEDAGKVEEIQKKLDEANAVLAAHDKDPYKVKYEAVKEDFENYKKEQTKRETEAAKLSAYKKLLAEVGISDKRIDAVARVADLDKLELDDKGAIKDADELKKSVKDEWADFIPETKKVGADVDTPPANNGGKTELKDIYKKDEHGKYVMTTAERQKAIAENLKKGD